MNQNELTIRTYMGIMAERDAAIQERNMALEERKRAFAERDMAMLQRDAAIAECNSVIQERDEAIAALSLQENEKFMTLLDTTSRGKHNNIQQQMHQIMAAGVDADYAYNFTQVASETGKPRKVKQLKESKTAKFSRAGKIGRAEGSRKPSFSAASSDWNSDHDASDDDVKTDTWKDNLRWGNEIKFDESVMPAPVCTCTGSPQPCYRWGNGGWQSACCTTTISMYPLPQLSNKRYTRVGGRKMSGSAFTKLLNRLASEEGYNLSNPLDLKDHWAKHGTNRYSTVK